MKDRAKAVAAAKRALQIARDAFAYDSGFRGDSPWETMKKYYLDRGSYHIFGVFDKQIKVIIKALFDAEVLRQ